MDDIRSTMTAEQGALPAANKLIHWIEHSLTRSEDWPVENFWSVLVISDVFMSIRGVTVRDDRQQAWNDQERAAAERLTAGIKFHLPMMAAFLLEPIADLIRQRPDTNHFDAYLCVLRSMRASMTTTGLMHLVARPKDFAPLRPSDSFEMRPLFEAEWMVFESPDADAESSAKRLAGRADAMHTQVLVYRTIMEQKRGGVSTDEHALQTH